MAHYSDLPTTTTNKKRLFEFISVSLLLGLTAAIGTMCFWLAGRRGPRRRDAAV